jgi:ribonuclease Z
MQPIMKSHLLLFLCWLCLTTVSGQAITVTLLGTGTPQPSIERFGAATLVEAGGRHFLFDCGRGAAQRIWQKGIPLGKVSHVFLTHLHSDHVVGLPDLWLTGWLGTNFGRRTAPLDLYGPEGVSRLAEGLTHAFAWDIAVRSPLNTQPDSSTLLRAQTIQEGIVYDRDGVRITAFRVDHADNIPEAYGYRLDHAGRSVVISGDTRYNDNLIRHAKGTDVLVHEVAVASAQLLSSSPMARMIQGVHTSPEDAGRVFTAASPKLAVYTHLILLPNTPEAAPVLMQDLVARTRTTYTGDLEVGEDLMTITIGDEIRVSKPQ